MYFQQNIFTIFSRHRNTRSLAWSNARWTTSHAPQSVLDPCQCLFATRRWVDIYPLIPTYIRRQNSRYLIEGGVNTIGGNSVSVRRLRRETLLWKRGSWLEQLQTTKHSIDAFISELFRPRFSNEAICAKSFDCGTCDTVLWNFRR